LVKFGETPAKIYDELVEQIYSEEYLSGSNIQPLYQKGETLRIVEGVFSGFESVYQEMDGEKQANGMATGIIETFFQSRANFRLWRFTVLDSF
jgi:transcription antitermination factor NusG